MRTRADFPPSSTTSGDSYPVFVDKLRCSVIIVSVCQTKNGAVQGSLQKRQGPSGHVAKKQLVVKIGKRGKLLHAKQQVGQRGVHLWFSMIIKGLKTVSNKPRQHAQLVIEEGIDRVTSVLVFVFNCTGLTRHPASLHGARLDMFHSLLVPQHVLRPYCRERLASTRPSCFPWYNH